MLLSARIVVDPEILAGKPVIRGTRLAVEFVLELLAAGKSETEVLTGYPGLTREDILGCLALAGCFAHEFKGYPISVSARPNHRPRRNVIRDPVILEEVAA